MIVKTGSGFKVTSEGGKNLSAPDLSHGEAVRRLQQVEYFKRQGKAEGGFVHTNPSDKQKEAGNYQKGHAVIHGMRISLETPAGAERSGTDPSGKEWTQKLSHDYGYIRGTTGKDKDHIDAFLGPDESDVVHVIDQNKKGSDEFDEHKAMIGFKDPNEAIIAYHRNYEPGWDGFRSVTSMPVDQFRDWAYAGRSGKRKPAAEYVAFKGAEDHEQQNTDIQENVRAGIDGVREPAEQPTASATGLRRGLAAGGSVDCGCEASSGYEPRQRLAAGGSVERRFPGLRVPGAAGAEVESQPAALGDGAVEAAHGLDTAARAAFADGGSTTTADDRADRASNQSFIGFPRARRRPEASNAREASKDLPLSAARGVLAGTLGLPGDVEGLIRSLSRLPSLNPAQALLSRAVGDDTTPALPTSEFFNEALPGRVPGKSQETAEKFGNLLGVSPLGAVKSAAKGIAGAGPALRGALSTLAENASAPRTLSSQAGAVKMPGGNWFGPHLDNAIKDLQGGWDPEVRNWLEKRVRKYAQNEMGTARDPLLKLEAEGKLHLTPEQLAERADDIGDPRLADNTYEGGGKHFELTGRDTKSPWEQLSDTAVGGGSAREILRHSLGRGNTPDWLMKMGNQQSSTPVYDVAPHDFRNLDFSHVRDYLDAATEAGRSAKLYGRDPAAYGGEQGRATGDLIARNLDIDPSKLDMMSLPDVIRKVSDWNDLLAKGKRIQDVNKGIKGVLKQYEPGHPNEGFQWAELSPEALADEGNAMGHCVGGYCRDVESGNTRIVSLRDKEGQPHVTVELAPSHNLRSILEQHPWTERNAAEGKEVGQSSAGLNTHWTLHDRANAERAGNGDYAEVAARIAKEAGIDVPWDIAQIKGKSNKAPIAEYLPAVQDLVKSMGPWGEVRDLQNTGLRPSKNVFNENELEMLKSYGEKEIPSYLTREDENRLQGLFPKGPFPMPESRSGFAQGGAVGTETVGLGQFGQGQQGQAQMQPAQPAGWGFGTGGGGSTANQNSGINVRSDRFGLDLTGQLPGLVPGAGGAPNRNLAPPYTLGGMNTAMSSAFDPFASRTPMQGNFQQAPDEALRQTLTSGRAGSFDRGAAAFLGAGAQPWQSPGETESGGITDHGWVRDRDKQIDQLFQTAAGLGMNTNGYSRDVGPSSMGGERTSNDIRALYDDLNQHTKDYYGVSGMSSGWDGSSNPRSASRTLYRNVNGTLLPASNPQHYVAPRTGGWARQNQDVLTAVSMMLPMFGGFAGLAGTIPAEMVGAGGGLGLTSGLSGAGLTAANAGVNALGAAAMGGGAQGALGSLAGGLGGAAGQYAGNLAGGYDNIGRQLGTQAGRYLYDQSQRT